jgi:GNAT superfamily N-acetyltransferase
MDSREIGPAGAQPLRQAPIASEPPAARAPLQALLERCHEFIALTCHRAVRPDEAGELLAAVPPGLSVDDKVVFGLFAERPDELVGVIDLLRGYPSADSWWIGLCLIDPAWRGRGLGERVIADLHAWFRQGGATASWLCVVEQNPGGLRFWQRAGYEIVDRRVQTLDTGIENQVWRLRFRL